MRVGVSVTDGRRRAPSTLQVGVYNHVPGDGRELVVTDADAVKIRAEDGRCVEAVDISPFISNLPFGKVRSLHCPRRRRDGLFALCAARASSGGLYIPTELALARKALGLGRAQTRNPNSTLP